MNMLRLVTLSVVALVGAMVAAPAVAARPLPAVTIDLSVDGTDCSAVVVTANISWQRVRLTAYPDYMIEWFAVGSFSQTLGTSAFDPGKWAGKPHGSATVSFTRDGYFDTLIYGGSSYSAVLRVVATGQVVASSIQVPITNCVQPT